MARSFSAEEVLAALIETLVNPSLSKVRPFAGVKAAEPTISNQMEAVAWLYNHYLIRELPYLEALEWEHFCVAACHQQTKLSNFMRSSLFLGIQALALTEQKIKNACELSASLKESGNIREARMVTKVCVCLLNFRQDKCVLVLGASTVGVWSFIEKNKPLQTVKHNLNGAMLSDEELAFQAVEEHTGITSDVLQIRDSFLISDDYSGSEGRTKFYIMLCSGTFDLSAVVKVERIAWVLVNNILPKASEPLIDTLDGTVKSSPAVQYFLLRPFSSSLEKWITMQKDVKRLEQSEQDAKDVSAFAWQKEILVGRQQKVDILADPEVQANKLLSKIGYIPEVERCNEETVELLKANAGLVGMKTDVDAATTPLPQLLTDSNLKTDSLMSGAGKSRVEQAAFVQKLEEDKRVRTNLEIDGLVMESQLSIGSPQSSTLFTDIPQCIMGNGESTKDFATNVGKQVEDQFRQVRQTVDEVALSLNISGPNNRPHSTRTKKREEEHPLEMAETLLSLKAVYRNVRKKRKAFSKELREHMQQADELYKKISDCDSDLAILIGGGKGALQLALELSKKDVEKQTSSSDISVDHSHLAAHANSSQIEKVETCHKTKPFRMLKSSIQELNEVCSKNAWPMPSYGVFTHKDDRGEHVFSGKVKIRNDIFELSESGEASCSSKKAKQSAAAFMLSTLHRLRDRNSIL